MSWSPSFTTNGDEQDVDRVEGVVADDLEIRSPGADARVVGHSRGAPPGRLGIGQADRRRRTQRGQARVVAQ
jgi:hypothetical protein